MSAVQASACPTWCTDHRNPGTEVWDDLSYHRHSLGIHPDLGEVTITADDDNSEGSVGFGVQEVEGSSAMRQLAAMLLRAADGLDAAAAKDAA